MSQRQSFKETDILPNEVVHEIVRQMPKVMGSPFAELIKERRIDMEGTIRFQAVSARCKEAREKARLTLKDVATQLKVPQYRIRDIEERGVSQILPDVFQQYIQLLGLGQWYKKWESVNGSFAIRLALGKKIKK